MASLLSPPQSFCHFSDLPAEIRLRIWQFAAPRRPRVIQIGYDPENSCWKAWKDGLGGLPSIVHVSREARREALKPYTQMFDAYVDPKEDTIFISDPIFSIRAPRCQFLSSEHANKLRSVVFTSEIWDGLWESSDQFPNLCEGPMRILQRLESLHHFYLVLSEDGAGFEYSDEDDQDDGTDEDEDEGGNGKEDTSQPDTTQNQDATGQEPVDEGDSQQPVDEGESGESVNEDADVRLFLDQSDEDAMEIMSRGYFRHLGNIHFESAMDHPDHWEAWEFYRNRLAILFIREKEEVPHWIRPLVSVMAIAYGLRRLGSFWKKVHLLGDHGADLFSNHSDLFLEGDETEDTEDDSNSEPETGV